MFPMTGVTIHTSTHVSDAPPPSARARRGIRKLVRGAQLALGERERAARRPARGPSPTVVLLMGGAEAARLQTAALVATQLRRPLWQVDLRAIVATYIGETEKNLSALLDAASEAGAVLFFDEADALFGKRTGVQDSHDKYANQEVSYLLGRLETYPWVVMLSFASGAAAAREYWRRSRALLSLVLTDSLTRR